MEKNKLSLAAFVRKVMDNKKLSLRDVAENSGGEISHTTVSKIINNRQADVGANTLKMLAKGLGISESEMFNAVRAETFPPSNNESLQTFIDVLNEAEDEDLDDVLPTLALVKEVLQARKAIRERSGNAATTCRRLPSSKKGWERFLATKRGRRIMSEMPLYLRKLYLDDETRIAIENEFNIAMYASEPMMLVVPKRKHSQKSKPTITEIKEKA